MDPFEEMEEAMNRFPQMANLSQMQKAFVPAMDVYQTDKAVVVETPLAGVRPEDVEVTVEKGVLTLKGESKNEHEVDEKDYYRKEVRSGSFFRQLVLPTPVLEDKVTAEFAEGVLKITCPKAEAVAVKKIAVKIVKKEGK